MEMILKKSYKAQRRFLAVVFFLGVNAMTVQTSAEDIVNENVPAETGVHISGRKEDVVQSENISLDGKKAVAILVEGSNNRITIPKDITITLHGQYGKGVLISSGRRHILNVDGNIFSHGNAVEFNFGDVLVDNFNLSGTLAGSNCAIYIGENSFVRNINIDAGAKIFGDIISDRNAVNVDKYFPDRVTNFNINTDFVFDGNIAAANGMKIHINNGTMKFSGAAEVLSVDVGFGAKLYGGTFTLKNPGGHIAEGFTDNTTGTFINHGTIGAGSPDTNLIINGNLISDGILQKISGGSAGSIIVNGNADINGSTVTTDSSLPNETAVVLTANSITGNIKNPPGKPVQISAMLNATGEIIGNTLTVTTHAANNDEIFDLEEKETLDAMKNMFDKLDDKQQDEMRQLYNLAPPEAKHALNQIGSNDAAQILSVVQQNTVVDRMISSRVSKIFVPDYVNVNIRPIKFADGEDNAPEMTVKVKTPSQQENNFWLNYMKNWGRLRGGTDYHGSVIVGGYDRPIGNRWRAGIFATYGTIGYSADSSRATVYDTRLGLYAGYHNRESDVYFYVNGGQLRNSLHRGISSLGLSTNANYKSHIVEIGGEYKYDLQPKKIWHVSPFINFQASHLRQNAYSEHGADIYNQHVDAGSNNYFAAQAGIDLKRYYRTGMFGLRFGVKHGFTGADPDLKIRYEGDISTGYRLRKDRDNTHFVFSVRGESEFARGWFMGGEAELQRGENDKDITASVMLRRTW